MFGVGRDDTHIVDAIQKSQGTIEFTLDGKIITANENFLALMGYELGEVKGKHHSMFVAKDYAESSEYAEFWQCLGAGEFFTAEFHRVGKGGKDVWIQATYCPVLNRHGKPYKVFKFASDITADKRQKADYAGQIAAIGKSQAVIEFDMDGTILSANQNFLDAVGYQLDEIVGKHHRIFVGRDYANSAEYERFWKTLRAGNYTTGEYQRFGKNNKEVWIQASYNPIMDLNGRPFKVVKYAADITQDKLRAADYAGQIAAIGKSQAVIEFDMDGTIIDANDNFLNAMGYTLADLKGKNHSMCVMPEYAQSDEYAAFWAALRRGEYQTGEFKRMGRGGKEVWISASYNPVFDMNGRPFKVVKYATDVTKQVMTRHTAEELAEGSTASAEAVASASEEMLAVCW